jgi:fructokinase
MIVVAGEALIDLVAEGHEGLYRAVVGGSPANVAVSLARLRQPVRFLGRLGEDAFGRQIQDHLRSNGVGLDWAVDATEPTPLAVAALDLAGRAAYDFYLEGTAAFRWTSAELPLLLAPPAVALHTGSLALALPPGADVLEGLLARERTRGKVTLSIDLNLRPSICGDRQAERSRVERQLRFAHIVKASEEDLDWLYPDVPVEEVAASWRAAGVACCLVTLGADGAFLRVPDGSVYRQTGRRVPVVDTVGAGDAFTGALLAGLSTIGALGEDPVVRLAGVSPDQWRAVLDLSDTVAAITCTRRGANPPTFEEIEFASG